MEMNEEKLEEAYNKSTFFNKELSKKGYLSLSAEKMRQTLEEAAKRKLSVYYPANESVAMYLEDELNALEVNGQDNPAHSALCAFYLSYVIKDAAPDMVNGDLYAEGLPLLSFLLGLSPFNPISLKEDPHIFLYMIADYYFTPLLSVREGFFDDPRIKNLPLLKECEEMDFTGDEPLLLLEDEETYQKFTRFISDPLLLCMDDKEVLKRCYAKLVESKARGIENSTPFLKRADMETYFAYLCYIPKELDDLSSKFPGKKIQELPIPFTFEDLYLMERANGADVEDALRKASAATLASEGLQVGRGVDESLSQYGPLPTRNEALIAMGSLYLSCLLN